MRVFKTTTDFINNHVRASGYSGDEVIETQGFASVGDQGGGLWKATGNTIAASQTPLALNDIKMSDASGNEFELVHVGIIDLNVLGGTSASYINIATTAGLTYSQSFTSVPSNSPLYFDTVASMQASPSLSIGDTVIIGERANSLWDVIAATTNNGYDVLDGTGSGVSLQLKDSSVHDIKAFGAVADGVTDDSGAINRAFVVQNGKELRFTSGVYELGSTKLEIDNPITLTFDQGVTLQQQNTNVSLLEIDDTADVVVKGNGALLSHSRTAAGNNTFYIRGSQRVRVEGLRFLNSPKDAIYIGQSIVSPTTQNEDIIIKDCDFDASRRQGISVICVDRLHVEGCSFHDISGDLPQAGIDLEANDSTHDDGLYVRNVSILGNKFYDITSQSGLYIATGSHVSVIGNQFDNNLVGINVSSVLANTDELTISAVDHTTEQFTVTGHGLSVGDRVFITTTGGGTVPTGATANITYRVNTVVDPNTITLSTYYQSVPLSITDNGTLPLQIRKYDTQYLTDITIEGNTFKDMINQAIICDEGTAVEISGNVVNGGDPSNAVMLLNYMDDSIVSNNIIRNTTDGEGIFCSGIRTDVVENIIIGTPDEGIRYYGGEASKISGNKLIDCGNDSTRAMDIRYFSNGQINYNRIWDESSLGISQAINLNSTDTTDNQIFGNQLKDSCASNANSLANNDSSNITLNNILDDGALGDVLTGSTTWDPASIATGSQATTTISITGAEFGDFVTVSTSINPTNLIIHGHVSAADTVKIVYANMTGGSIDLASHTVSVRIVKG